MLKDFEDLRFSYEGDVLQALRSRFGEIPLLDHRQARQFLDARRQELLGDAVRVTADLLPEVHQVWRSCLDMLDGGLSGDLFVRQSSEYNASVFAHDRTFDILIHSSLINEFTPDELRFVFGHELGHVVFNHSLFPVRELIARVQEQKADEAAARLLLRWSRASEISADRVGMLCCGRLGAATTALFRTSSGLAGIDESRALQSLRSQYAELETRLGSSETAPLWIRTHPMIPIRFKAIELAALDLIALGRETGGFSARGFRTIDRQIAFALQALDRD